MHPMDAIRRTILWERHHALGATLTEFGGWEMPLYYTSITGEHLHTRSKVGMFDLCHMGRLGLRGPRVREFLDWLTPAPVMSAPAGRVLYSFLLNERGGVIDDITIYVGADGALLVVNASNREKDHQWIEGRAATFGGVEVCNWSDDLAMLAVQGPLADGAMKYILGDAFEPLGYYTFRELSRAALPQAVAGVGASLGTDEVPFFIYSATGYTGEAGYEIYAAPQAVVAFWDAAMAAAPLLQLLPVGLGARDSLRLEAAMPLYGHELTEERSPLEAGLGKFVDFAKPVDFIGRRALDAQRDQGVTMRLAGLEMVGRGPVPRHGYAVKTPEGQTVGSVTSGVFSPTLQKNIALAYVESSHATPGTELAVEIRGRLCPVRVVRKPFYRRSAST
jgi:aminomethyltransferase